VSPVLRVHVHFIDCLVRMQSPSLSERGRSRLHDSAFRTTNSIAPLHVTHVVSPCCIGCLPLCVQVLRGWRSPSMSPWALWGSPAPQQRQLHWVLYRGAHVCSRVDLAHPSPLCLDRRLLLSRGARSVARACMKLHRSSCLLLLACTRLNHIASQCYH
jgi:hypothetical protein